MVFSLLERQVGPSVRAAPVLAKRVVKNFLRSLDGAPAILPAGKMTLRRQLEHWFESHRVRSRVVADVSSAKVIRGTGIADIPGSGVQGCSYGGRRGFPLQTSNKAAASAKARDIYICLAANGWEAPLAR
jgi:hypothetical protein